MTERQLLRLTQAIILIGRRAKCLHSQPLTRALDIAGYYAGLELGKMLAAERERDALGEEQSR
jgi:hypothetical protein